MEIDDNIANEQTIQDLPSMGPLVAPGDSGTDHGNQPESSDHSQAAVSTGKSSDGQSSTSTLSSSSRSKPGILHQPDLDFGFWRNWNTVDQVREFFGGNCDLMIESIFQAFIDLQDVSVMCAMAQVIFTDVTLAFNSDAEITLGAQKLSAEDEPTRFDKMIYLLIHYWQKFGRSDVDHSSKRDFFYKFLHLADRPAVPPSYEASFWEPLKQNTSTLEKFYEYLIHIRSRYVKEAGSSEHYAPFVVLFQTSGSGKSFLVKSVAEKGIYVAYLNARSGFGYPEQSPLFKSGAIMNCFRSDAQLTFACYIQAALESIVACTAYGIHPVVFTRWMVDPSFKSANEVWEWLMKRILEIWKSLRVHKKWDEKISTDVETLTRLMIMLQSNVSTLSFQHDEIKNETACITGEGHHPMRIPAPSVFGVKASGTSNKFQDITFLSVDDEETMELTPLHIVATESSSSSSSSPPCAPSVLFALDELSSLTESHRLDWRRACCVLPKSIICLPAMMDTVSTVSVIAPEKINDPSARVRDAKMDLIFPFYWLSIFTNEAESEHREDLERLTSEHHLDIVGRPLWAAYGENHSARREVAILKLLDSTNLDKASKDGKFALLACRFPMEVNSFDLANNLVGHHARYCQYLSEDRSAIISAYASEPILPRVSAIETRENKPFELCLETCAQRIRGGAVSVGDRGETAAAIIIQRAFDVSAEKQTKTGILLAYPYAEVTDFLRTLLCEQVFGQLEQCVRDVENRTQCSSILKGRCFFNHFIQLYEKPDKNHLTKMAMRCAAAVARRNEFGFDLLVPVIMPDMDGQYKITENNMSYLLFQVKNRENGDGDFKTSSVAKLASHATGLELLPEHMYISIYMSLSTKWKTSAKNLKAHHLLPHIDPGENLISENRDDLVDVGEMTDDERDDLIYRKMCQNNRGLNIQISGLPQEMKSHEVVLGAWNRHRQIAIQTLGISTAVFPCLTPTICEYIKMIAHPMKNPALMPDSTGLQKPFIEETFYPGFVKRKEDPASTQASSSRQLSKRNKKPRDKSSEHAEKHDGSKSTKKART